MRDVIVTSQGYQNISSVITGGTSPHMTSVSPPRLPLYEIRETPQKAFLSSPLQIPVPPQVPPPPTRDPRVEPASLQNIN